MRPPTFSRLLCFSVCLFAAACSTARVPARGTFAYEAGEPVEPGTTKVEPGPPAPGAVATGSVERDALPVGVRDQEDGSVMLLFPLRLPEPAFELLSAEDVRPLTAGLATLGSRLSLPVRSFESPWIPGRATPGELRLRDEFLSAFGPSSLPLPESTENSPLFKALQMSPRFMGEGFRQAAVELFTSPIFILSVCLSVVLYFSAWLAPEPLFTKAFAAAVTLRLSLLVGLMELGRIAQTCLRLYQEANAARTPAELEAASEHFGKDIGGVGLRVLVALVGMGLGRLLPGAPEGGLQLVQQSRRAVQVGGQSVQVVAQSIQAVGGAKVVAAGVLVVRGVQAGTALTSACGALNPCAKAMGSADAKLSTRYGPPHTRSNPPHNEAIEEDLAAREAAGHEDLLKNKAQMNAAGDRRYYDGMRFRRPDASSVRPDGVRHNVNYVSNPRDMKRELEAFQSMADADKRAIHELYRLDGTLVRRIVPAGVAFP